jgi:hypothetical protein
MDTHDARADHPRAQIGAIIIEAIHGLEAKLGMSVYEHAARVVNSHQGGAHRAFSHQPAVLLQSDRRGRVASIEPIFIARSGDCAATINLAG